MAVLLSGCATAGRPIDQSAVQSLRQGVTTYDEVRAQMGTPTMDTVSSDGRRGVSYIYTKVSPSPLLFVPIVGIFFRDIRANGQTLSLKFAPHGVLEEHKLGTSNFGTNVGL